MFFTILAREWVGADDMPPQVSDSNSEGMLGTGCSDDDDDDETDTLMNPVLSVQDI